MNPRAALVESMDINNIAYWGAYGFAPHSGRHQVPGALLITTPIPSDLFNTVFVSGGDFDAHGELIGVAATTIAESGVPVLWRLSDAAPVSLAEALLSAGLQYAGRQPAMLAGFDGLSDVAGFEGLEIKTVQGRKER